MESFYKAMRGIGHQVITRPMGHLSKVPRGLMYMAPALLHEALYGMGNQKVFGWRPYSAYTRSMATAQTPAFDDFTNRSYGRSTSALTNVLGDLKGQLPTDLTLHEKTRIRDILSSAAPRDQQEKLLHSIIYDRVLKSIAD